jgi:LysR family transcriptional regulator, glycine cleavage system transcriptional activator
MADNYRDLPLNALRTFAIASRHRTFTAAANYMGKSQVAISRQIAMLETYLNVKLFERSFRSVKLTEAGLTFGSEIARLFDDVERATSHVLSNENDRTINVRVYPTFAHHWLLPRLPEFTQLFPDYRLRLNTVVERLDFRGTYLNVALQLGDGNWREANSRKLFDEEIDLVCSPAYAERFGYFAAPADLSEAEFLHAKYRRGEWDLWARSAGYEINCSRGLEFDSSLLTYSAAKHGFGAAIGQLALLKNELACGELIRPLHKPVKTNLAFWVVWPTVKSVSTSTKYFIDWLLETSGQRRQFFKTCRRSTAA